MKISKNWLEDYIQLPQDINLISETLTSVGLEVAKIEKFSLLNENLIIGHVLKCSQHPDATRLKITKVDIGTSEPLNIVCGAPNVTQGQKVVVAPVGTTLEMKNGEKFKIKKSKIRGEISEGMICAEDEIGLSDLHEEIIVLDTDLPPGTSIQQYYNVPSDYIYEIETTPNRTDAFSHIGVARDVSAALDLELKYPTINQDKNQINNEYNININLDQELGNRYAGLIISDIKIEESPLWLKNKLLSIGLKPLNNIVDITNYVLHETGQPLHAFDYDKISNKTINIRKAKKGEILKTLDSKDLKLEGEEILIADSEKPICLAGIIGGDNSAITEKTSTIFLESASFDPTKITKASKQHEISTDASFRFERGTDPNGVLYSLHRAKDLILQISKGKIKSKILDVYPEKKSPSEVKLALSNIERLIGEKIPTTIITKILKKLEIEIKSQTENDLHLIVPTYRRDVTREADIIEEILRIYGYNKINVSGQLGTNYISPKSQVETKEKFIRKITDFLIAKGYNEIITNSLTKADYSNFSEDSDKNNVEIINPLSQNLKVLRKSLIYSGLEIISNNINRNEANLLLFEIGKEYYIDKENEFHEKNKLGIWITGNIISQSFRKSKTSTSYYDLINILDEILIKLRIGDIEKIVRQNKTYETAIEIKSKNIKIGEAGMITPQLLNECTIKQPVYYAELDIAELFERYIDITEYKELSVYPQVSRDLSIIINDNILYQDIERVINNLNEKRIIEYYIYDVYQGEKLPNGKKTCTLKFKIQDSNKTLRDKDIDKIQEKLIQSFEKELNAEIKRS